MGGEHRRDVNDADVTREEIITDLVREEIITDLVDEEFEKVLDVYDYKDLVVRNMRQIGCTHLIEIDLKLQDEKPVYYKPYCMTHSER